MPFMPAGASAGRNTRTESFAYPLQSWPVWENVLLMATYLLQSPAVAETEMMPQPAPETGVTPPVEPDSPVERKSRTDQLAPPSVDLTARPLPPPA